MDMASTTGNSNTTPTRDGKITCHQPAPTWAWEFCTDYYFIILQFKLYFKNKKS